MEKTIKDPASASDNQGDLQNIVRGAIEEFIRLQQSKSEPAYKVELMEERKRREQLERRMNEMAEENRRSRVHAEEVERGANIRGELQRLGVTKIDLAFKAVKDDILRTEDGRLIAKTEAGEVGAREYLTRFLNENPELLPGRIQGGSGAGAGHSVTASSKGVDIDRIKPGMSAEDLDQVRQEIIRVAGQNLRGV
jgi:hypothetical protein